MAYHRMRQLSQDKNLQAYVIDLALGDGNLSKPSPRAVRLRITCDNKYPKLIKRIRRALQFLLPENKVSLVDRSKEHSTDVSVYSNQLENLLGWCALKGPKHIQNVSIPTWIKTQKEYYINCLRGLIETDGSIYLDRGYRMVIFSSIIEDLAKDVFDGISFLGFGPHLYKLANRNKNATSENRFQYQVRLSKDVTSFLELVKPEKN